MVLFMADMKSCNQPYQPSLREENPCLYWAVVLTGALVLLLMGIWAVTSVLEGGDTPVVQELYLESLAAEREWVRSEDPNGEGGVSPVLAKREYEKALKALRGAVNALPEGENASLRVSSYIRHRSADSLMEEVSGK